MVVDSDFDFAVVGFGLDGDGDVVDDECVHGVGYVGDDGCIGDVYVDGLTIG